MKAVIIGDIHGHDSWKQIVKQNPDADKFIFVGDYFDSFSVPGLMQMHNFKEIIEFKNTSGKEVITLIGNHDFHYLPEINDKASGYQYKLAPSIGSLLNENREHLQVAYRFEDFVFSHAGISSEWMNDIFGNDWTVDNMVDKINELFFYKSHLIKYRSFKEGYLVQGYGDEPFQGPLWIRPKSLMRVNRETLREQVIQIVGHTIMNTIDIEGKSTGGRYYFIDTLPREYLIINNNVISVGKF